jgi:Protein of unknown function (DUF2934)
MNFDYTEVLRQLTASLAYQLWEQRGRPDGTPETDWQEAERLISSELSSLGLDGPPIGLRTGPKEGAFRSSTLVM